MRWEDERYVRAYTRDTPEWTLLSWEARGLFLLLLRAVDRAGLLNLGKAGNKGIASLLRVPLDVVDRVMPELVVDGCVTVTDGVLVVPNFIEAQEAAQTDAARKRGAREKARAVANARALGVLAKPSENDPGASGNVTEPSGHVRSGHSVPSLAVSAEPPVPGEREGRPALTAPDLGLEDPSPVEGPSDDNHDSAAAPAAPATRKRAPKSKGKAADAGTLPEDWSPPPEIYAWAAEAKDVRLDADHVGRQLALFRDKCAEKGRIAVDWAAAFRNWLRKAREFSPDLPSPMAPRAVRLTGAPLPLPLRDMGAPQPVRRAILTQTPLRVTGAPAAAVLSAIGETILSSSEANGSR